MIIDMRKEIVLIPGALASAKLWQHQENHFRDSWRLHYVDMLNSDSIAEMANRFASIAPEKFTLIGFSMGGYVALELYRLIPDKIEKLILINSSSKLVSQKGILERERSIDLILKGKFDFLIKLIFKNSIHNTAAYSDLLALTQAMAREVGAENYIKQLNAILNKPDQSSVLSTIECPTLLIASKEDRVMPVESSEYMAKQIKHAELIYIQDCGHMAMLEKPNVVNGIISDWL